MRWLLTMTAMLGLIGLVACSEDQQCGELIRIADPNFSDNLYNLSPACDWGGTCFDQDGAEHACMCRGEHECGEGYSCLRGPSGHCICMTYGSSPSPGWEDPNCLSVQAQ